MLQTGAALGSDEMEIGQRFSIGNDYLKLVAQDVNGSGLEGVMHFYRLGICLVKRIPAM
jgi:hypothetical protein